MSSEDSSTLSLDVIEHWNVDALKDFLRLRGLKTTGRKKELRALVFSASQLNVPLKIDELTEDRLRSQLYSELLLLDGIRIPDPFVDLKDGWLSENDGVKHWPPICYFEIAEWLLQDAPAVSQPSHRKRPKTLKDRLLSDYKEGKAYSYFDSKWLKEVSFHPISAESTYCVVKAECVPSQSVRSTPHKVWVIVEKKTGRIRSAYCTCFAGLGSSCNHVAAIIFKLDHAFMSGASGTGSLPCTSKPCTWNTYKGANIPDVLEGKRVCDLQWVKPSYVKGGTTTYTTRKIAKQLFNPTQSSRSKPTSDGLINALFPSCQGSSVFRYLDVRKAPAYSPAEDFNTCIALEEEVNTSVEIPQSLPELANACQSVEEFVLKLQPYTEDELAQVEKATRGQSDCDTWRTLRAGRVTASNLRSVVTRNRTLKSSTSHLSKDPVPLVKRLMGYEGPPPHLPNLKYGRLTEPKARDFYTTLLIERGHQNVVVEECGLYVHKEKPFISASPDAVVNCSCCGEGLLEIKCPRSIAGEAPSAANCEYLTERDGVTFLRKNHQYFMQVQTQLACTGRQWCDFFIYTSKGFHLTRLHLDADEWKMAQDEVEDFFFSHLVPELVERKIHKTMTSAISNQPVLTSVRSLPDQPGPAPSDQSGSAPPSTRYPGLPPSRRGKRVKKSRTKPVLKPLYMCTMCAKECLCCKNT